MDNFWYIIIENYRCPIKNQVELTRKEEPNENLAPFFMLIILRTVYIYIWNLRAHTRTCAYASTSIKSDLPKYIIRHTILSTNIRLIFGSIFNTILRHWKIPQFYAPQPIVAPSFCSDFSSLNSSAAIQKRYATIAFHTVHHKVYKQLTKSPYGSRIHSTLHPYNQYNRILNPIVWRFRLQKLLQLMHCSPANSAFRQIRAYLYSIYLFNMYVCIRAWAHICARIVDKMLINCGQIHVFKHLF